MKINSYLVIEQCVERGVDWGYSRAHKHTDAPAEAYIKTEITHAVMNELSEFITFDDDRLLELIERLEAALPKAKPNKGWVKQEFKLYDDGGKSNG
jgi:hypothetical protein